MKIAAVILFLGSIAGAQCTSLVPGPGSGCVGPVLITTASPTVQSSIILVDISKPVPTPAATQYILSIVNGTIQESDNGGAYHMLVGPKGIDGTNGISPTIAVGTVTSGPTAAVTNSGTANAAVFNFVLQKGNKGDQGNGGTVAIGNVTSGPSPSVTNVGTPQNAIFNFVLQPGAQGNDSFQIGSSMTVIVTGCNIVGVGRSCVLKRVK